MRISDWSSDVCSSDLRYLDEDPSDGVAERSQSFEHLVFETLYVDLEQHRARQRGGVEHGVQPSHGYGKGRDLFHRENPLLLFAERKQRRGIVARGDVDVEFVLEIGRASCRERVCQYV